MTPKQLIYHLTFMFYEINSVVLWLLGGRKLKVYHYLKALNKQKAMHAIMAILGFDLIVLIEFAGWITGVSLSFSWVVVFSLLSSFIFCSFFLYRNDYFEKTFLPRQAKLPFSERSRFYLLVSLVFLLLPAAIAVWLLID